MHENDGDLSALQLLLDDSYARAGAHLRSIHTPERRVHAPARFRAALFEVYPDREQWYPGDVPPPYARIDATLMYAYAYAFEPSVLEELVRQGSAAGT